jgi:hypothetical protein
MGEKGSALIIEGGVPHGGGGGGGSKWHLHGRGTNGAAACLLPYRHAKLVSTQPVYQIFFLKLNFF